MHFYFFSTNTWENRSAPVEDLAMYRDTMRELECSDISQNKRTALETKLLGLLEVYDIGSDESDAFDETDERENKIINQKLNAGLPLSG